MNRVDQYLADKLNERSVAGNLRQLKTLKAQVDFFSNDYLGLVTTGKLAALMQLSATAQETPGSTGSRLLSGNNTQVEALESAIARFHGAEAALVFNSGYNANIGLLQSIGDRNTTILYDELCHASLIDGVRLSLCKTKFRFTHNDMDDLEDKLSRYSGQGPVFVVAESVYSMDGDMAPLNDLVKLCDRFDAQLIVDEAHSTGVFGNQGRGLVNNLPNQERVFARIHTFGKALGCHGASIACSELLKQYLINFARPFIYTTALPGLSIHAAQCAYEYLLSPGFTNQPLHDLISYFREKIKASGIQGWKDSHSPVQAFVTGSNEQSKNLAARLQLAGLQVNPILHPTVPLGMERLRVCLHSFNTRNDVDRLFEILQN